MNWRRKLLSLTLWNGAAAGLNFVSNIIIARTGGLDLFGTLSYLLACAGMLSLLQVFIPSSFAIVRLQDDEDFFGIYSLFFAISILLALLLSIPISSHLNLPVWIFCLQVLASLLPSYTDTIFQSRNQLHLYFIQLFAAAFLKILVVVYWAFATPLHSFSDLLLWTALSALTVTSISVIRIVYDQNKFSGNFAALYSFFISEKNTLAGYYQAAGVKVINGHLMALVCDRWVTRDVLGIYSLLMKVYSFIVGLVRTPEALLVHREGIRKYAADIKQNSWLIAMSAQAVYIVIGTVYMKVTTGETYWQYQFMLSLLLYPYVWFLQVRAKRVAAYDNDLLNRSALLYMAFILLCTVLQYFAMVNVDIMFVTGVFILATLIQYVSLLWLHRKYPLSIEVRS